MNATDSISTTAKTVRVDRIKVRRRMIAKIHLNDVADFILLQMLGGASFSAAFPDSLPTRSTTLRDDYLQAAQLVIPDPMILINVISKRAKQLKSGYKPLIESLERLSAEDLALREVMEGKITYQLDEEAEA